jgi:hypothetical protein
VIVKRSEFQRVVSEDPIPDASYLEQEGFEDRRAEYRRGAFHLLGVQAKTELMIPYGLDFINVPLSTPGLWGIESDCGEDYLAEVFEEESKTLASMIESIGKVELVP